MRTLEAACLCALLCLAPAARGADSGWRPLFDGMTLKGWRPLPPGVDCWKVEEGWIRSTPAPSVRADLISLEEFGDFELTAEWRISPGGNSGIKYLVQQTVFLEPGRYTAPRFEERVGLALAAQGSRWPPVHPVTRGEEYVIAFEFQVADDAANPDARSQSRHATGALYDMVAPTGSRPLAAGEVNRTRIAVEGTRVQHWLNDVKVLETSLDSPAVRERISARWRGVDAVRKLLVERPRARCPITLQHHNDAVWFRNVRVRAK